MKRLKKILKWTGIVLGGLVVIGLAANAVFVWTTDTRLERQLAEIRAGRRPVDAGRFGPPADPAGKERRHVSPPGRGGCRGHRERDLGSPEVQEYSVAGTSVPMPPKVQKAIKTALDAHPNVMPLLEQAAACPDYDPQLDYSRSCRRVPCQLFAGCRAEMPHADSGVDIGVRHCLWPKETAMGPCERPW